MTELKTAKEMREATNFASKQQEFNVKIDEIANAIKDRAEKGYSEFFLENEFFCFNPSDFLVQLIYSTLVKKGYEVNPHVSENKDATKPIYGYMIAW